MNHSKDQTEEKFICNKPRWTVYNVIFLLTALSSFGFFSLLQTSSSKLTVIVEWQTKVNCNGYGAIATAAYIHYDNNKDS
jgi:hypothetical protein